MRKLPLFLVALIVAAGAFWVTMLTIPPQTGAAQPSASLNINDLMIGKDLPIADATDAF